MATPPVQSKPTAPDSSAADSADETAVFEGGVAVAQERFPRLVRVRDGRQGPVGHG